MINEINILEAVQTVLRRDVNQYLPEGVEDLVDEDVQIEFPSVDLMRTDKMLFIQPNYAEYSSLATTNDASNFTVSVFLICKRDTPSNLTIKTFGIFNAVYEALRKSMSLDGVCDFVEITDADFYPAIEANKNTQGVELTCAVHYTKDF